MKRKRYSVEQTVAAVRQHDLGVSAADIARKLGIAEQTCVFQGKVTTCSNRKWPPVLFESGHLLEWPALLGMGGSFRMESVADFVWNTHFSSNLDTPCRKTTFLPDRD